MVHKLPKWKIRVQADKQRRSIVCCLPLPPTAKVQPEQSMATSLVLRFHGDRDLADRKLGTVRGSATAVPAELHPRMEPGSRKGAEISPDLDVAAHRCSTGRPWGFPA